MCRLYLYLIYIILRYVPNQLISAVADQEPMLVAYDRLLMKRLNIDDIE